MVFQYFSELGNDNISDHFTGFKYGLMKNLEVGLNDESIVPETPSVADIIGIAEKAKN